MSEQDPYDFLPQQEQVEAPESREEFEKFRSMVARQKAPELKVFGEETEVVEPAVVKAKTNSIKSNSSLEFLKTENVNPNPLTDYFRVPEFFVRLPSQGIFNKPGDIEWTVDGQIGIYPMTAADDLILRTPDALLNGSALEQLITSCVPGVKNVRGLTSPDFDVLLLGVRKVSFGDQLDYVVDCPKCKKRNTVSVSIEETLLSVNKIPGPVKLIINGLELELYPYTFDSSTKAALITYEETQLVRAINSQDDMSEKEKKAQFIQAIGRLSDLNSDLLSISINAIKTPDGKTVTDKTFILEFIKNISKDATDTITNAIKELNTMGYDRFVEATCSHKNCGHDFKIEIKYDPTNFFVKSF